MVGWNARVPKRLFNVGPTSIPGLFVSRCPTRRPHLSDEGVERLAAVVGVVQRVRLVDQQHLAAAVLDHRPRLLRRLAHV